MQKMQQGRDPRVICLKSWLALEGRIEHHDGVTSCVNTMLRAYYSPINWLPGAKFDAPFYYVNHPLCRRGFELPF